MDEGNKSGALDFAALLEDLRTIEGLYNRDRIAQPCARQIERIFDRWLHDDPSAGVTPPHPPTCALCGCQQESPRAMELCVKASGDNSHVWASWSEPPHPPPWQPIDTAPKNATMIMVAARSVASEPLQTMFAYWSLRHGWWYRLYAHEATRIYPTHWMPLPDPPALARPPPARRRAAMTTKDPIDDLADAESCVPPSIRAELLDCATANGRISYLYLLRLYKRGVRDGRDASEGVLSMAVHRLEGIVEGSPTHRGNFLQRIDELRELEVALTQLREGLKALINDWRQLNMEAFYSDGPEALDRCATELAALLQQNAELDSVRRDA